MKKEDILRKIIDNALLITLIILVIYLWSKGHFACKCPVYQCVDNMGNLIINNISTIGG